MMFTAPATVTTASTRAVAVPLGLDELRGPRSGRLRLPASVYWGPEPTVDLRHWDDVAKTYEATLREGDPDDVRTLLNGELLAEVWSEIVLPGPVRAVWERRFPALARR
ncbi:hypothetical protein FHW23_000210 [Curtobacterium pusillum]|uniref:Transcriptional regulator n=1 Tax=Curtobacterium pusillum TaxID=69373 RepID=A0AAW3T107_9MICO|nr:hypothetical protein [Curtobacterium pusillum]MBA8988978.1 hypothetical protein [Curtobacterium pusillum]